MKLKKYIFDLFKKLDIYGFNFSLRYQQETEYNTICGVFFSLISISIILTMSFVNVKKILFKDAFSLVTNYNYLNGENEIELSAFPVMISVINLNNKLKLDERYVTFKFDLNIYTPNQTALDYVEKQASYPLELEECSLNSFYFFKDLLTENNYINNFCLKTNKNISIKGTFDNKVKGYKTLEFHLLKCENSTENNNHCKSNEEINDSLRNSYFSLFSIYQTTDHFNKSNPILNVLNTYSFYISLDYIKRYSYFISKDKYISDNGKFFNLNYEHSLVQIHHTSFELISKNIYNNNLILDIIITCDDFQNEYIRSYVKIQDLIGFMGGIFDIISIFFQLISYNFIKKSFIIDIGNNLISVECKKVNNINHDSDFSNQNIIKIQNKCHISSIPLKRKNIEEENIILFNIKMKNYILSVFEINNDELKSLKTFNKKNKKFTYYLYYYIFPFFTLGHFKRYRTFGLYLKIFKKMTSFDFFIPMILNSYKRLNI